jgi:hypothetical protein
MDLVSMQSQLKGLELQIQLLKAKLQKSQFQQAPPKYFGDLYGLLKGQVESTEEEIDAVLYRVPMDSEL